VRRLTLWRCLDFRGLTRIVTSAATASPDQLELLEVRPFELWAEVVDVVFIKVPPDGGGDHL
ncbi:MAG: hypothetical protein M3488_00950, partial [Actinomycetota bacterium]|nr:hypothetical protein [Actinomycetota bacterium]